MGLLLAIVVVAWIRYQPLTAAAAVPACPAGAEQVSAPGAPPDRAAAGQRDGGTREGGQDPAALQGLPAAGSRCVVVTGRQRRTIRFGGPVRNDGPLGVRVTAVRIPEDERGILTVTGVDVTAPDAAPPPGPALGLRPFRLAGGDLRSVWVSAEIAACEEVTRPVALAFEHLPLRVRVFGLPRDAAVPLPAALYVVAEPC